MKTYKGPATLLTEEQHSRKFDTEADLVERSPGDWGGTLAFRDATLVQALMKITYGHVLIDGQPGEVVRRSINDWSPTTAGPFVMTVMGSGLAPF